MKENSHDEKKKKRKKKEEVAGGINENGQIEKLGWGRDIKVPTKISDCFSILSPPFDFFHSTLLS